MLGLGKDLLEHQGGQDGESSPDSQGLSLASWRNPSGGQSLFLLFSCPFLPPWLTDTKCQQSSRHNPSRFYNVCKRFPSLQTPDSFKISGKLCLTGSLQTRQGPTCFLFHQISHSELACKIDDTAWKAMCMHVCMCLGELYVCVCTCVYAV